MCQLFTFLIVWLTEELCSLPSITRSYQLTITILGKNQKWKNLNTVSPEYTTGLLPNAVVRGLTRLGTIWQILFDWLDFVNTNPANEIVLELLKQYEEKEVKWSVQTSSPKWASQHWKAAIFLYKLRKHQFGSNHDNLYCSTSSTFWVGSPSAYLCHRLMYVRKVSPFSYKMYRG